MRATIPFRPLPWQREFMLSRERFRVVVAARRAGKTLAVVAESLRKVLSGQKGSVVLWAAPTYQMARAGWDYFRKLTPAELSPRFTESRHEIELPAERRVLVRSLSEPDSTRGCGADFIVMDEADYAPFYAWDSVLRPSLAQSRGGALFITTPSAGGWVEGLFRRASEASNTNWKAFRFPIATESGEGWRSAVPHVEDSEIEELRRTMTERAFRREVLAEFVEGEGRVFQGIMSAVRPELCLRGACSGSRYVLGFDVARSELGDYSALVALEVRQSPPRFALAHVERWRGVEFSRQAARVEAACMAYSAPCWIDETGLGMAFVEMLLTRGLPVLGVNMSTHKRRLIERLSIALEGGLLALPDNRTEEGRALLGELAAYTREETGAGRTRYSAPPGEHDDLVMALALALYGAHGLAPSIDPPRLGEVDYW